MANRISAWIYGELQGEPPYIGGTNNSIPRIIDYSAPKAGPMSFANSGINVFELSPTVTVGGVACNAVIEVLPTGLNVHSKKYATDSTVSTINTNGA